VEGKISITLIGRYRAFDADFRIASRALIAKQPLGHVGQYVAADFFVLRPSEKQIEQVAVVGHRRGGESLAELLAQSGIDNARGSVGAPAGG
jgi:hypothetical protein